MMQISALPNGGVVLILAAASLAPAKAGQSSFGNTIVCEEITANHVAQAARVTERELNEFLFDAAERGCLALVEQYLNEGASVGARDRFGNIPMMFAAKMGHRKVLVHLIDAGSDLKNQPRGKQCSGPSDYCRSTEDSKDHA